MVIDKNRTDFSDFLLENEKIVEVEEFPYLRSIIDTKCSSAKEIKSQLYTTWRPYGKVEACPLV